MQKVILNIFLCFNATNPILLLLIEVLFAVKG